MKKIFFLTICTLASVILYAQDIIITRDAQRIEAKIMEVSSSEIKYKELSNLDGPMFVLNTSEINTIIYKNGTVKIFDTPAQNNASYQNSNASAASFNGMPINKSDDVYYMGDQRLTEDQYVAFVQKNCMQAYEAYTKGKKLRKTGVQLISAGVPLLAAGAVLYGVGIGVGRDEDVILGCGIPGAILMGVGSGLTVASIPCMVVGSIRKNNSHEVYNAHCARPVALQFNIQTTGTGLGLAMKF